MRFSVRIHGPLDAEGTLARYHVWGEDPVNRVADGHFRRVLRQDGRLWPYEVRWRGPIDDVTLDVEVPGARAARVEERVRREIDKIFGLDFDVAAFYRMAKAEPSLAALATRLHGLRPTLTPDALEMLVGSITAQQITLQFAFQCRARLVRRYGTPVEFRGEVIHAFPEPEALAHARIADLRALKYSGSKAEYLRIAAQAILDGTLDAERLEAASNEAVVEAITGLRGLGRWTAEWFLARCLARGDVCPAGDLGVRRAFERYWGRGRTLTEDAVRRRAKAWGPYQNLAVHYLLAGLRLKLPGDGTGWNES